jgi:ABC-2 type transport system permease protein
MNFPFFKKTIKDFKWSILWYGLSVFLYGTLMVSFFPTMQDMGGEFEKLLESYPPAFLQAFGVDIGSFNTIEGFLSVEYLSFIWVIILGILLFTLGASIISGEIDKGTSEFSFTLPIKRQKIVLEKFAASFFISLIIIFITLITIIIGAYIVKEILYFKGFLAFFADASALSFFLLAFAAFLSSLFSNKGKVYGICGGFFAFSYAVHVLVGISDRALDFYFLSFFKYYGSPGAILASGSIDIRNIAIFLTAGAIFLILGLMTTEGRDLS